MFLLAFAAGKLESFFNRRIRVVDTRMGWKPFAAGWSPTVRSAAWLLLMLLAMAGCASPHYRVAALGSSTSTQSLNLTVSEGGEHPRLDQLETAVHYPATQMKKWFGKSPNEPGEPPLTDEQLIFDNLATAQEYMALHGMTEIYVDIRAYEPAEQWRRLRANGEISGFWKYTGGTLQHVQYCLVPGRVLRRDNYNVFTNTLSINSTRPEQTLYAAATAKYLCERDYPGAIATSCYFPVVPLLRDYHVANDVLSYARYRDNWDLEQRLYPHVYGNFGSELVSQGTRLLLHLESDWNESFCISCGPAGHDASVSSSCGPDRDRCHCRAGGRCWTGSNF